MQRYKHAFLGLCLCAIAVGMAASVRAEEQPKDPKDTKKERRQLKPERLVSDNALFYASIADFTRLKNAFARTAFKALLSEDEVQGPLSAMVAKLKDTYIKGDGTRTETEVHRHSDEVDLFARLAPYFDGQVAISAEYDPTAPLKARFLLIAGMPPGELGDERQRLLDDIMERHRYNQITDPRFRDYDDRIGNYDIHRIENTDLKLIESWAFVENLFVYGWGKKVVDDAVERYAVKNGAGTLAQHTGFQNSFKEVGRDERSDSLVYFQLDVNGAVAEEIKKNPGLGLLLAGSMQAMQDNRPQVALGIQVGEGENAPIREKILMRVAKESLPKVETCRAQTARFAPIDPLYYSAAQGNLGDYFRQYIQSVRQAPQARNFGQFLDQLRNVLAANSDDELASKLELFKGELATIVTYSPQSSARSETWADLFAGFSGVFILELDRDNAVADAAFKNLMSSIEKATGQTYVDQTFNTASIRYQKGAMPREERSTQGPLGLFPNLFTMSPDIKNVPFFLSYARLDLEVEPGAPARKYLLMSDSINGLKKAISQTRTPRAALAEDKSFRALQKSFRDSLFQFNYLDLGKVVDIYATLQPVMVKTGVVGRETINQFPNANTLKAHVCPIAWAMSVVSEQNGILIESSSPTGNVPLAGMIAAVAYPAVVAEKQKAISAEVDEKFKRISLGIQLYAADFDRFPLSLSDLNPTYIERLDVFEPPFRKGMVKTTVEIDNPDVSNLVYVPGKTLQDLGKEIIVYEKEPTFLLKTSDGNKLLHHVLTVDGKMSALPRVSLDRRLGGKVEFATTSASTEAPKPEKPANQ